MTEVVVPYEYGGSSSLDLFSYIEGGIAQVRNVLFGG